MASIPGGNLVAVWSNGSYDSAKLESSFSADNGVTWSAPTQISPSDNNTGAQLVVGTNGSITVLWTINNSTNSAILSSTSTDGGATWSAFTGLSRSANNGYVSVAASDGVLAAVWMNSDANGGQIQGSTSTDDGRSWTEPSVLSTNAGAGIPSIAADADGDFTAVWGVTGTATPTVESAHLSAAAGLWSAPATLGDLKPGSYPELVVNADGGATALWLGTVVGVPSVASSSSSDGVLWSTPAVVTKGSTTQSPRLAVAPNGDLTALWISVTADSKNVQTSSSSDDGATWSAPVDITTSGKNASPELVVDAAGTVTAAWFHPAGPDVVQSSSSADGGATWSAPVSATSPGYASQPALTIGANDRVVAAWVFDLADDSASEIRAAYLAETVAITSASPTSATQNAAYSFQITATGDPAPTFAISGGALPTGLTLNATTGLISGTPTATGSSAFTVTASNGVTAPATADYTLTVSLGAPIGQPDSALTPALENGITLDRSTSLAGGTVVVGVPTAATGDPVSVWMHSTPRLLGDWFTVSSTHTVTVTIPADAELGAHRIVVQNAQNEVIGWSALTVVEKDTSGPGTDPGTDPGTVGPGTTPGTTTPVGALASTGIDLIPAGGSAALLLIAGLLLALRTRARSLRREDASTRA